VKRIAVVPETQHLYQTSAYVYTVGQVAAAALLTAAATWMPWATHKVASTGATTSFTGGPLGAVLAVLGLVLMVLAVTQVRLTSSVLSVSAVFLACVALACSIAMALTKIHAANSVAATSAWETSYSYGAIVGVVASIALVVLWVSAHSGAKQSRRPTDRDPQS
jgi:hypothetical protein